MKRAIHRPIHTAALGAANLRFFKSNSVSPDAPWHSCDDIIACLKLPPNFRTAYLREIAKSPYRGDLRTIATRDGIARIAPHRAAVGLIRAAMAMGFATLEFEAAYIAEIITAIEILAGDLPPNAAFEFSMACCRFSMRAAL